MRVGQRVVGEPFRSTDCHSQCAHWLRNDGLFARATVGRRDTWVPPYTALLCRGGRPCPPGSVRSLWCVGGLSYPPSCQPTDGHCRTRQSGHFLETGSLHPPLAALRRFPCASEKTPFSPQTCAPSARALPRAAIPLKKAALPLFLKLIAMV